MSHFLTAFQRLPLLGMTLTLAALVTPTLQANSFINPKSYDITAIIPPFPETGSEQYKIDTWYLKNARATSTQEQINKAIIASHDSVFDYTETLGPWFNSHNLPKTKALFNKVDDETKSAIELAKNHFHRKRPIFWLETGDPEKSNGYSYPSGHTTRAFIWAIILSDAFPDMTKTLHLQARQKAWYRVILGRHYPADVRAGMLYGKFLAEQFLKSPEFQLPWKAVTAEMKAARSAATTHGK